MHFSFLAISSLTEGAPDLWELYGGDLDGAVFDALAPDYRIGFLSRSLGEYFCRIPVRDIDLDSPDRFKEGRELFVPEDVDRQEYLKETKLYWDLSAFVGCDGEWVWCSDIEDWDAFIDEKIREAPDDAVATVYDCHR